MRVAYSSNLAPYICAFLLQSLAEEKDVLSAKIGDVTEAADQLQSTVRELKAKLNENELHTQVGDLVHVVLLQFSQ